jgi:hypothetical protein
MAQARHVAANLVPPPGREALPVTGLEPPDAIAGRPLLTGFWPARAGPGPEQCQIGDTAKGNLARPH